MDLDRRTSLSLGEKASLITHTNTALPVPYVAIYTDSLIVNIVAF